MARLKIGFLQSKVASSSLLEVVVSLVLITVIFSISMMIYTNTIRSGISLQQAKGILQLQEILTRTQNQKSYFDEEISMGSNNIIKKVVLYHSLPGLFDVSLKMMNAEQKTIAEKRELLFDLSKQDTATSQHD